MFQKPTVALGLLMGLVFLADGRIVPGQAARMQADPVIEALDRRVGRDLVLLRYLYKCENSPVIWYFAFYRNPAPSKSLRENDIWRVITVRFDTKLELLEMLPGQAPEVGQFRRHQSRGF